MSVTTLKSFIVIFFIVLMANKPVHSQGFIAEIVEEDISALLHNSASAMLDDSTTISGKLMNSTMGNGFLKSVTLQDAEGKKHKLKAEEILTLKIKASDPVRMNMVDKQGSSIKKFAKTDFQASVVRDFIFFERATHATKKDKPALVQLLNPGFDTKIKIFTDPNSAGLGDLTISSGTAHKDEDKTYLLAKQGINCMLINKANYKKLFSEIYDGCPELTAKFKGDKIKFSDIAAHVFIYNQYCAQPEQVIN